MAGIVSKSAIGQEVLKAVVSKDTSPKEEPKDARKRKCHRKMMMNMKKIADSQVSVREPFNVEHPDWGDERSGQEEEVDVPEDPNERREMKSQAWHAKKDAKKGKPEKDKKREDKTEKERKRDDEDDRHAAHGRKSELESSSDHDKREDRERGPSRSSVVLKQRARGRDRPRSPVVQRSCQQDEGWGKSKGKPKARWAGKRRFNRDEISASFMKCCENSQNKWLEMKRNKSTWETVEVAFPAK